MNIIEKVIFYLYKKLKPVFFSYPTILILYFYIFILGKILYITYHVNGYNIGDVTLLYMLGLLIFLGFHKLLKKRAYKIFAFSTCMVIFLLLIYYGIKHEFVIRYINDISVTLVKIYDRENFDYTLIQKPLMILLPIITFVALYLDTKGLGVITIGLCTLLIIIAFIYHIPKAADVYLFMFVYLSCLYFIISIYARNKLKFKSKEIIFSVKKNLVINLALLFSLVMILLSSLWIQVFGTHNINDIISRFQENLIKYEDIGKKNIYTISKSGFGNSEKLGGSLTLNNRIAFRVKSDKPYYLRGSVKDSYDGYKWINSYDTFFFNKKGVIFSPGDGYKKYMLGINDEDKSIFKRHTLPSKSITIYPETLKTSTLFSPYNTFNIKCGREAIGYTYDRTFMLLNNFNPNNQYSVSFYESNTGVENFINNNENKVTISYEVPSINDTKKETEYYEKNIRKKYEVYLSLPENISKDTYDLVNDLVKDCNTTEEKLMKIYEYLNTNYDYSLDVSEVPEGQEFLHYFLFNEKKGYCTYFATATVVFCRIIGVPARYVEGFKMDDTKDPNGLYIVGNDKAHAWTEILLSDEHNIWSVLDPVPASSESQAFDNPSDNLDSINTNESEEDLFNSDEEAASSETTINEYYNEEITFIYRLKLLVKFLKTFIYILIIVLAIMPFACLLHKITRYRKTKRRILNAENIEPIFSYSKKRLEVIGLKCSSTDTEFDFIKIIEDEALKAKLSTIVSLYHEEYYGEKKIIGFDKKQYYNFIEEYISHKQNIFSYYYWKYFKV